MTECDRRGNITSTKIGGIRFGGYQPSSLFTNAEIAGWGVIKPSGKPFTAQGIIEKLGVERRFTASDPYETVSYMAKQASRAALGGNREIEAIIFSATLPHYSAEGHNQASALGVDFGLDLAKENAIDVNWACAGGVRALNLGHQRFFNRRVLIVASEKLQERMAKGTFMMEIDPGGSAAIFSDGAQAIDLTYGQNWQTLACGDWAFPDFRDLITLPVNYRSTRQPADVVESNCSGSDGVIIQNGKKVYEQITQVVPDLVLQVAEMAQKEAERSRMETDIKMAPIIVHQASKPIVEKLEKQLQNRGFNSPLVRDYQDGNCSSASVFKALSEAIRQEAVKPDQPFILAGFGAGLAISIHAAVIPGRS